MDLTVGFGHTFLKEISQAMLVEVKLARPFIHDHFKLGTLTTNKLLYELFTYNLSLLRLGGLDFALSPYFLREYHHICSVTTDFKKFK